LASLQSLDPAMGSPRRYTLLARTLHWLVALLIVLMVPLGLYMVDRGEATNFDATTGLLYDLHKLVGFALLWIVVVRLLVRLRRGAPPPEPTLTRAERAGSAAVHHSLYLLLLVVPLLGWAGVSAFPALRIFDLFNLPAILPANEEIAKRVLDVHGLVAKLLGLLALAHIAAALYHRFVKRDGVFGRMWPGA